MNKKTDLFKTDRAFIILLLIIVLAGCNLSVSPDPPEYTVSYHGDDADSGSVPVDSNSYLEGQSATVLGNINSLTRNGYTFSHWNTAEDGNGTSYSAGDELTLGAANADLYAIWTNTGTITINNPDSPVFSISPSSLTLQTGGGITMQELSVTTDEGITIESYIWQVNGTTRGTETSITLNTETNPGWFELGQNTLTLVIVINGIPYSDNFIFTVEQYSL